MWFILGFGAILKGSLWLYTGSILFSFLGLLFWMIASFFVNPDIVGTAAAILSYEVLLLTIISLGIPRGLQRFIGECWGTQKPSELSKYFSGALLILITVSIPVVLLLFLFPDGTLGIFGFNQFELLLVCIFILLDFWPPVFYSLFRSVQRAEISAIADIVLSVVKLATCFILLSMGFGFVGILMSFIIGAVARALLFFYSTNSFFNKSELKRFSRPPTPIIRNLLKAGSAHWIPNTLLVIGQSVSVLFLYGTVSNYQAGLYFMAFSLSLLVYNLPESILGLMLPFLSGLKEGRQNATSWAIRISLAATIAPSLLLFIYSSLPFTLLGPAYAEANEILRILVLGAMINPITSGYTSYVYAEGKYYHVVAIGSIATVGRLFFYFYLGSIMGSIGVALAYIIGIALSFAPMYFSSRIMQYKHDWKLYLKTLLIPSVIALTLQILLIPWFIGTPILLCITFVFYTKLRVINKTDLIDISEIFLSRESIARVAIRVRPIIGVLFDD